MCCRLYLLFTGGFLGSQEEKVLPEDGAEWALLVLGPS